jgi:ferritin-like metal-binding protein YciE
MRYDSLQDVLADQLADLWSAERQLMGALPRIADAAASDQLRSAVREHLAQTAGHVERLEWIIGALELRSPSEQCEAMQGLVREADRVMSVGGDPITRDVALIAAAQRVEHYEISAYGTACALASELGLSDVRFLLGQTLDEERDADRTLNKIATGGFIRSGLNERAVR